MYYVVLQIAGTKIRHLVGFSDKEQFEEDYLPAHGDVIAQGVSKSKAEELCGTLKVNSTES